MILLALAGGFLFFFFWLTLLDDNPAGDSRGLHVCRDSKTCRGRGTAFKVGFVLHVLCFIVCVSTTSDGGEGGQRSNMELTSASINQNLIIINLLCCFLNVPVFAFLLRCLKLAIFLMQFCIEDMF